MKLLVFSILFISVLVVKLNNGAVINSEVYVSDEDLPMKWNEFKIENNLTMESVDEDKKRFELFKSDYIQVKNHNLGYLNNETSFSTCVNQFSVMSQDEYIMKYTIQTRSLESLKNITQMAMPSDMPPPSLELDIVEIPDTFDWRALNLVAEPEYGQGICGSSWAFAATSAIEILYAQRMGRQIKFSKQELLDCTTAGCDGGWPIQVFQYAVTNGLIEEEFSPYVAKKNNCSKNLSGLERYKIKGYANIQAGDEEMLKRIVATYGPVAVAIDASDWAFGHYSTGIYLSTTCKTNFHNHAVLVVGYGVEDGQDYWIVKNSWGRVWGQNGYIRMARNKNNMCGIASVAVYGYL